MIVLTESVSTGNVPVGVYIAVAAVAAAVIIAAVVMGIISKHKK